MDDATFEQESHKLARQFVDLANQCPAHGVAIDALLMSFQAMAIAFPCCARIAGEAALKVGAQLLAHAGDDSSAHASKHIH